MVCFPCAVAKRDVELRLADQGANPAEIVARVSATLCLMCAAEREQASRNATGAAPADH